MSQVGPVCRSSRRRRSAVAILVAVGLVVVSACSNGGDSGSAQEHSSSDSGTTLTGTPIELGVLVDSSSQLNSFGQYVPPIITAWADYTNKHGGVGGHPVDLVIKDTKGDVPTAVADARSFVGDSAISGVLVSDASSDLQIGPILSKAKLPIVGGTSGFNPQVWGGPEGTGLPYVYSTSVTFPDNIVSALTAAKVEGAKSWMTALCVESPACNAAKAYFFPALKAAGVTNAGTLPLPFDAPNYTAQCLEAIQKNVDVISMQAQGPAAVRMAQDCTTQGYKGHFEIGQNTVTADVYQKVDNIYGPINGFPWFVDAAPVVQFRQVMSDEKVPTDTWSNPTATEVYAGLELLKKAAGSIPSKTPVTRAAVIDAFSKIKDETLDGLLPQPMTFTKGGLPPAVKCFWVYAKGKDGKLEGSFTPTCDK